VELLILLEIPSPAIPDGGGIILDITKNSQYYGMKRPPFT
jgi:hypothetical protein